jgi:hypothetical protein
MFPTRDLDAGKPEERAVESSLDRANKLSCTDGTFRAMT